MLNNQENNSIERSREHLANERTFLAWIRTSIGLMGFGFVIVKFALFIKQLTGLLDTDDIPAKAYSSIVGVVMVGLGVIIAILALFQFKRNQKQLLQEFYAPTPSLSLFMSLMIIVGGILLIIYLLSTV
ncbi:MAG TPA: DUF202 domain-containing protein [Bacteroides sp.]|nr:DUF202 domain-containing protein [Bacteroides sp.]